ncbi:MAG: flagellar hook-length control protein FliK [Lachnospiraceae bacterium]
MQITNLFQKLSQEQNKKIQSAVPLSNHQPVRGFFTELPKGTIFEGTILSVKDGQVVIGLADGQMLEARLEESIQLLTGTSVFFEVKSNDGTQIALRPFQQKNSNNPTLVQALYAAGVEVNEKNLALVASMMEEQQPIDRQSILKMARLAFDYPGVNPQTLVQLVKYQLPVTQNNILQLEHYKGESHSVLGELNQIMDHLPDCFSQETRPSQELLQINHRILEVFTPQMEEGTQFTASHMVFDPWEIEEPARAILPQEVMKKEDTGIAEPVIAKGELLEEVRSLIQNLAAKHSEQPMISVEELKQGIADLEEQIPIRYEEERIWTDKLKQLLEPLPQGTRLPPETVEKQLMNAVLVTRDLPEHPETVEQMKAFITGMNSPEASNLSETVIRQPELEKFTRFTQLLEQSAFSKEELSQIFSGKEYRSLLKQVMEEQWLLKPNQVANGNQIQKLYEKLEQQLSKLETLFESVAKETVGLGKTTANVKGNISFMNEVNHLYNYVQIPLKLPGQHATGDLYVFKNKKSLKEKPEELSAQLHLVMDDLGTTDVYVRMQGKKITTNFYMEKEASFHLIEDHIEELSQRLQEKGYEVTLKVENKEKKVDFVNDFLNMEKPVGKVHRYSFDVRA